MFGQNPRNDADSNFWDLYMTHLVGKYYIGAIFGWDCWLLDGQAVTSRRLA